MPLNNTETMAHAIIALLKDRDKALLMGMRGKKRVEEYFNINTMVKKTEELYLALFAGKNRRGVSYDKRLSGKTSPMP